MQNNTNISVQIPLIDDVGDVIQKQKAYIKPQLEELGDLRSLTFGATCTINESGLGDPTGDPFFC